MLNILMLYSVGFFLNFIITSYIILPGDDIRDIIVILILHVMR